MKKLKLSRKITSRSKIYQPLTTKLLAKMSADSPLLRPMFRKALCGVSIAVLLAGISTACFADWIRLRWIHFTCRGHFSADQNKQAIVKLRNALRLDPANHESLFMLVRGHRREGDISRASLLLDHLDSLKADPERIQLERQLLTVQEGRFRESSAELSEMLMNDKLDGPDVLRAFVQGYFTNSRTNEAAHLIEKWQQTAPDDPQAYFMKGHLLGSVAQLSEAISEYRKGLKLSPNNQSVRCRLAECLLEDSQIQAARDELAKVDLNSGSNFARFLLAKCDYADQNWSSAEKLLDELLMSDPSHNQARVLRGRIRMELENSSGALADLQMAVDQQPTDVFARESLGRALLQQQRKEEADQHFDFVKRASHARSEITRLVRQLTLEPKNVELRFQIGQLASEFTSADEGAKWMRSVLELQPDHTGASRALADYLQTRSELVQPIIYGLNAKQNEG